MCNIHLFVEETSRNTSKDLWDTDVKLANGSKGVGLDLADFSAAALRFQTETRQIPSSYDPPGKQDEDALDSLIAEENPVDDLGVPAWAQCDEEDSWKDEVTFSGNEVEDYTPVVNFQISLSTGHNLLKCSFSTII